MGSEEAVEVLLQTARAGAGAGRLEPGRYDKALELAQQFGDRLAEAQLYEQRARDRLSAGQPEPADADLVQAAELFEALGAGAHLQRVQALQANSRPPTVESRLVPGVDLDDSAALLDTMERDSS